MLDWVGHRNEILARNAEMGKLSPDTLKGYQTLSEAGTGSVIWTPGPAN